MPTYIIESKIWSEKLSLFPSLSDNKLRKPQSTKLIHTTGAEVAVGGVGGLQGERDAVLPLSLNQNPCLPSDGGRG